jgi:hypothetical protein
MAKSYQVFRLILIWRSLPIDGSTACRNNTKLARRAACACPVAAMRTLSRVEVL